MSILPDQTIYDFTNCKLYKITKSIDRFYKTVNVKNLSNHRNNLKNDIKSLVLDTSEIQSVTDSLNGRGSNSFTNFILYFNNKYDQGYNNTPLIDLNEIHIDIKQNIVCTKWYGNDNIHFHKFFFNQCGNRIIRLEF